VDEYLYVRPSGLNSIWLYIVYPFYSRFLNKFGSKDLSLGKPITQPPVPAPVNLPCTSCSIMQDTMSSISVEEIPSSCKYY